MYRTTSSVEQLVFVCELIATIVTNVNLTYSSAYFVNHDYDMLVFVFQDCFAVWVCLTPLIFIFTGVTS